jgi:hypothetical protein
MLQLLSTYINTELVNDYYKWVVMIIININDFIAVTLAAYIHLWLVI